MNTVEVTGSCFYKPVDNENCYELTLPFFDTTIKKLLLEEKALKITFLDKRKVINGVAAGFEIGFHFETIMFRLDDETAVFSTHGNKKYIVKIDKQENQEVA